MNIGIFSGSFNPIHIGHLILANYITEFTNIDEVWFLVTPQNPFKQASSDLINQDIRLKMVELAVGNYEKMRASDFEFNLPVPSYTVNTMSELEKSYPQHTFSLIIGADNWSVFDKWKDSQQLIDRYTIWVYPRLGYEINIPDEFRNTVISLTSPIIEISSTFIRKSLQNKKNISSFLPCEVSRYIMSNGLYQ